MIRSRTTGRFREQPSRLPPRIQRAAQDAYRLWLRDLSHPGLEFKKLQGPFYSVRIGLHWRAVAIKDRDTFVWVFIGSHADYDKLGRG